MAEQADRDEALAAIVRLLVNIDTRLGWMQSLLSEFEPVIRAYLNPSASGPVAWAIRRQQRKAGP